MTKNIFIILFSFLLFTLSTPAHAYGQDVKMGDFNFDTPSDRWRIEDSPELNAIDIKYLRHGTDITIRVYKKEAFNRSFNQRKTKRHYWEKRLRAQLLESYKKQGFKFAVFKLNADNTIYAEGVDKDRNYILLSFHFTRSDFRSNFTVVESILSNNDYMQFKDSFLSVSRSIRPE